MSFHHDATTRDGLFNGNTYCIIIHDQVGEYAMVKMKGESCVVGSRLTFDHTYTIIFLHDRGSNGDEFARLQLESWGTLPGDVPWKLASFFPTVRWVLLPRHSNVKEEVRAVSGS